MILGSPAASVALHRADLVARRAQIVRAHQRVGADARAALSSWRNDARLAMLRDQAELGKLPAPERDAWQALWRDVDAARASPAKR